MENEDYKRGYIYKEKRKYSKTNMSESDYISDYSKNSRMSILSQNNNLSIITKSSISDLDADI